MMTYAEVAVNTPVDHTFHYHIPDALVDRLEIGHLVRVAFRTAMQPGIIVGFSDSSPVDYSKPIIETLDPLPVVSEAQIALARWISQRYLTPLGACLWTMLPPGMVGHHDVLVSLNQADARDHILTHKTIIGMNDEAIEIERLKPLCTKIITAQLIGNAGIHFS